MISGGAWAELCAKETKWLCRYAVERGLTAQDVDALPSRTAEKKPYTSLPRVASVPGGVGHGGDGSYTMKPNQWVPPTDGSVSPKPSRGTRGLHPSQAHALSGKSPMSYWQNDQSHPVGLRKAHSASLKALPLQASESTGRVKGAPDALPDEAMPKIDAAKMDELGVTSPQFRSRRRGMVANQNPVGGFQFMWPQDIPGGRRW